jgi:hypothetical protein
MIILSAIAKSPVGLRVQIRRIRPPKLADGPQIKRHPGKNSTERIAAKTHKIERVGRYSPNAHQAEIDQRLCARRRHEEKEKATAPKHRSKSMLWRRLVRAPIPEERTKSAHQWDSFVHSPSMSNFCLPWLILTRVGTSRCDVPLHPNAFGMAG